MAEASAYHFHDLRISSSLFFSHWFDIPLSVFLLPFSIKAWSFLFLSHIIILFSYLAILLRHHHLHLRLPPLPHQSPKTPIQLLLEEPRLLSWLFITRKKNPTGTSNHCLTFFLIWRFSWLGGAVIIYALILCMGLERIVNIVFDLVFYLLLFIWTPPWSWLCGFLRMLVSPETM